MLHACTQKLFFFFVWRFYRSTWGVQRVYFAPYYFICNERVIINKKINNMTVLISSAVIISLIIIINTL